jgi:adenine-specific DNA-methyltransferase
VVERCILLATRPGDLILDPTCGSGTTPLMAERWGRRWITIDTSRVPLALARQRLLTATYPFFRLRDESIGPSSGFVYEPRQNRKDEEVGGIVPHTKLDIANGDPPTERVLVDRPEEDEAVTRITGPFVVEATLPTPQPLDGVEGGLAAPADDPSDHVARMIEVLRRSPVLSLSGNRKVHAKVHSAPWPQSVAVGQGGSGPRHLRRRRSAQRRHRSRARDQHGRTVLFVGARRHCVRPGRWPGDRQGGA